MPWRLTKARTAGTGRTRSPPRAGRRLTKTSSTRRPKTPVSGCLTRRPCRHGAEERAPRPFSPLQAQRPWGRAIWLQTPSTICGSTGLARTLGRGISLPVSSWARRRSIQGSMIWGNSSSGSSLATMHRTCNPSPRPATRRVGTPNKVLLDPAASQKPRGAAAHRREVLHRDQQAGGQE